MTSLPITHCLAPASSDDLRARVAECQQTHTPIYSLGGETSLDYGLAAKREGVGISLANLSRIVDYPARDLTITVEAGVTMRRLGEVLAAESQWLPIDVPLPERATIGGVVACNWNGPRQFSQGGVRDHVIGISAVDGTGLAFKGGGRVVKNVAGYDFCKLLTGSMGTLAVITQVTLKLKPMPETSAAVIGLAPIDQVEHQLARLSRSRITPAAVEIISGPAALPPGLAEKLGRCASADVVLLIGLEGSAAEVRWMVEQLVADWVAAPIHSVRTLAAEDQRALLAECAAFPTNANSPLSIKACVLPSRTVEFLVALREIDPRVAFVSHAGTGAIYAAFSEAPKGGLSKALVGRLQPLALAAQGFVTVLSYPSRTELTPQAAWGGIGLPLAQMTAVKRAFDPHNILNPDRFLFGAGGPS